MEIVILEADRVPGGMALVPVEKLRKMAAILADLLQEQVGAEGSPRRRRGDDGAA